MRLIRELSDPALCGGFEVHYRDLEGFLIVNKDRRAVVFHKALSQRPSLRVASLGQGVVHLTSDLIMSQL